MDLQDNLFLLKSLKSLLNTETFQKTAQSKGDMYNNYIASYLNYVIATREFPSLEYHEKIEKANTASDYADITAQCIYNTLTKQILARRFKPSPASIYSHFAKNFYRNGLVFNAQKKGKQTYIDFPKKFDELSKTQPENSVVKAYQYSINNGKFLYFTPYPIIALDFASKHSGFWSVMLDNIEITYENLGNINQFLRASVAGLNLETEEKKVLFNDILESLNGYMKADEIELHLLSRDRMDENMACDMAGRDYGVKYGELKKFDDFDEVKQKYREDTSEQDVVLSELSKLGLFEIDFYCKERSARIEKIGVNVALPLPNIKDYSSELSKNA